MRTTARNPCQFMSVSLWSAVREIPSPRTPGGCPLTREKSSLAGLGPHSHLARMSTITRLNAALEGRYRIERELGVCGMATV